MRLRFPEHEPPQESDTQQHTANSRCKYQRVRRPHACLEPSPNTDARCFLLESRSDGIDIARQPEAKRLY
jgi:hypothetical protein